MKVYRNVTQNGVTKQVVIFDIAECTYTGKDMGERSITASIKWASPIDFKIGDYVMLQMQSLIRSANGVSGSILMGNDMERFYIYTMPTVKKNARPLSAGNAFEHTVTFYPAQYELGLVQMRDFGQETTNVNSVIYTGFDTLTFVGGADELMHRIMTVLKEAYHDKDGQPLWSYKIADAANENKNTALERVQFSFSGNSVMDALLKLNDKEGLNTSFFINGRTIYVGFKRPYFCRVTDGKIIDTDPTTQMFQFEYGKTSNKPIAINNGGLYSITKSLGKESPITKLFAYGASRNLNRYYCSDRIQSGRYVNRLMLPSFDTDGKTDFILSEDAIKKYGIREASKQYEDIYPSLRYMTYGDLRQIKYCIKIKGCGLNNDKFDQHTSSYPVARVQCYKVVPSGVTEGINKLVEAAPPDDLCVIVHAMGKTVKVVLYGGTTDAQAIAKQKEHDQRVPTRTINGTDYIPGSCFLVHDRGFDSDKTYVCANRYEWFTNPNNSSGLTASKKSEIDMSQIQYEDTFWLSDLYVFESYDQTHFSRDGYSAGAWSRTTIDYKGGSPDSMAVNEVVGVEPIVIEDTSSNVDDLTTQQKTFDIYLRDVGFKIDEQNDFGDMTFVVGTELKISILDGLMAGREFTAAGTVTDSQYTCICAYNDDGSLNDDFFMDSDYNKGNSIPQAALEAGAIWRICLNRINLDEADYSNLNIILPTKDLCVKKGDHLVFLDIFMPDIYIHAAENRLLREARKYLEANDNGSITYSALFDKVRMQQIPNYALQLREGLNIRMVDDDLDIKTDNEFRYLADYRIKPISSSLDVPATKQEAWLSSNEAIDFTRGKFYTIKLTTPNYGSLANTNALALISTKNDGINAAKFLPTYTLSSESKENGKYYSLTFTFELPSNFNDDVVYYPSLLFKTNGVATRVSLSLESVVEQDFNGTETQLNYADFTIDTLTVKITDSNRGEPIRDITATFSENPAATAWATLMSRIEESQIEGEQNTKAIETMVNTARKNYQTLLNLKNSIFDPDGTCDQTFLQVMMMQVGADSMNYQLDKTSTGLSSGGQQVFHNCSLTQSGSVWTFKVFTSDKLRHFVYTQGSQGGAWLINNGITQVLDGKSNYFICAKCEREGSMGEWICSTKQYAVNDDDDTTAWFFNWGILTVDSGGHYTLVETRGNAYMYGDNLVCGKISTLAGNSYFDLTHGNFVLSNGISKALSYENGILTIGGVNDTDADSILTRLGITEATANAAQTAADKANAEADKVRAEYQAAITAEEQARNTAITNVQNSIGSLQNQIDGEVTAWFLKGVPTLENQPAADWKILNDNGTIDTTATELEYKRHEGDTYTNMSSYEEDSENAGKSWRFCKGVEDTPKSGWHWHLIADSDAVKALVEAGKAQSTADGKSTTFVEKPTSYQVGDLWILQTDTDHTEGKKGDILTANVSSKTYNANHWSKDVKYTDDTVANQAVSDAANAKSAADNAKSVADAATTRLNNWAEDGVISPAEKQGIKDEIARIDADKSHITSEYTKYSLGTPTAFNTAHTNYRAILVTLSSTATETITIPSDFSTKQTAYYNARIAALTAISTKADEMAKAYADIVSAYAAQAALDNLEIGGRNLLKNSRVRGISQWAAPSGSEYGRETDYSYIKMATDGQMSIYTQALNNITTKEWKGKNITFSVMVQAENNESIRTGIVARNGSTNLFNNYYAASFIQVKANEWTKITSTFECPYNIDDTVDNLEANGLYFVVGSSSTTTPKGTVYKFKNWKIEFGNKATDWTPAPEDVEASIAENKTYADGIVKALGENLQNQIDGVVDSYFLEGVPTNTNYPANEWTTNELKQRHEGDTYTNIQQYTKLGAALWEQGSFAETRIGVEWVVGQAKYNANTKPIRLIDVIPNRKGNIVHLSDYSTYKFCVIHLDGNKKTVDYNFWETADFVTSDYPYIAIVITRIDDTQTSITDVADSGVVVNPDAGKSWRWCKGASDNPATTWHWHEIADSDAVRALQDAAKAQDTADGKRRVFITQPTPPYDKGDLWAQGSADGQEIKRCMTARATGSYNASDWQSASSALSKATAAADEAATAKTNAQTALTTLGNIANDAVLTKQEKVAVRTEWANIQAEYAQNTANAKVCWGDTVYSSNTDYKAYSTAYSTLSTYLTSTAKINDSTDTTIVPTNFNSAFSNYYGANVTLLNAIAKRVSELEAQAAVDNIEVGGENLYTGNNPRTIAATQSNFNYVKILAGLQNGSKYVFSCGKSVVKAGSTTQYAVLLYNFTNSTPQQQRLLPVGSTRVEQAFTVPSTGTWDMLIYSGVNGSTAGISMEYTDIMIQKGNKATDYQNPTRVSYYSGSISIPYEKADFAVDKLLVNKVPAGVGYICEMISESVGVGATSEPDAFKNSCLVWFKTGKKDYDNVLQITNWGERVNVTQEADLYIYTGVKEFIHEHLKDNTSTGVEFSASGTWAINGVNISQYTTDYLSGSVNEAKVKAEALDYLKAALENDKGTEIAGGLLMTNVLQLRNLANKVTAGMSGLTKYKPSGSTTESEDNVLMWGGGTYPEAFYASRNTDYNKSASGTPITTLLKKDGTGKIGIFKISDDSVIVDNGGAKTIITNQSANEYCKTIGFETVIKDFSQTSQMVTSYDTVIAEKTFSDNIYGGVAYIRGITFYCDAYGTYGGSLSSNSGATLSISVTVYNLVQNKDVTYNLVTKEVSNTDTNVYYVESISQQLASNERLKSYKIELKKASIFGTGSIHCSFRYFIGAKDAGRMCVLAKDGIILSSGIGQQFIVRPNSTTLDVIADIPVIKTKSDVKALQAGQLYTDSSGIVRRLSEEEAYQIAKDERIAVPYYFTSLNILLREYSNASDIFVFKGFNVIGRQNTLDDNVAQFLDETILQQE